jgi:hypothetical protein
MDMDASEITDLMVTWQLPHISSTSFHLCNCSVKSFPHLVVPMKLEATKQFQFRPESDIQIAIETTMNFIIVANWTTLNFIIVANWTTMNYSEQTAINYNRSLQWATHAAMNYNDQTIINYNELQWNWHTKQPAINHNRSLQWATNDCNQLQWPDNWTC